MFAKDQSLKEQKFNELLKLLESLNFLGDNFENLPVAQEYLVYFKAIQTTLFLNGHQNHSTIS